MVRMDIMFDILWYRYSNTRISNNLLYGLYTRQTSESRIKILYKFNHIQPMVTMDWMLSNLWYWYQIKTSIS